MAKRLKFHGVGGCYGEKKDEIREYDDQTAEMLLREFPHHYEFIEDVKSKPVTERRSNKKSEVKDKK